MERARRLEKTAVPDPNTHPYRSHSNLHTIPAKLRRYLSTTYLHRGITRFIRNLATVSSNKSKNVGSSWPRGSQLGKLVEDVSSHACTNEKKSNTAIQTRYPQILETWKGKRSWSRALLSILRLSTFARILIAERRITIRWRLHLLLNYPRSITLLALIGS